MIEKFHTLGDYTKQRGSKKNISTHCRGFEFLFPFPHPLLLSLRSASVSASRTQINCSLPVRVFSTAEGLIPQAGIAQLYTKMWFPRRLVSSARLPQTKGKLGTLYSLSILANRSVWECHSWYKRLDRVSRERWVSRERRVCSVRRVAQRRSMDMRIKSWWQSPVGRLLDWTRNHQLEQAAERNSDRREDYLEKAFVMALPSPQRPGCKDNS